MADPTEVAVEEEVEELEPVEEEPGESEEPAGEEPEQSPEPVEAKPTQKKTAQERINEITRKRREAEREAEYWRQKALEKETEEQPKIPNGRPLQSNFDTVEEYEDALIEWHDQRKADKIKVAEEAKARNEMVKKFNDSAKEMRAAHDDFDEVIEAPIFTDTMRKTIFAMDTGPMVAYHLGSNPDIADTIKTLSPERQIYEIYKLETSLKLAQKKKTTTSAPEPITPVGDTGGMEISPDKMSIDEWMAWDKKRQLEKIKHRIGE